MFKRFLVILITFTFMAFTFVLGFAPQVRAASPTQGITGKTGLANKKNDFVEIQQMIPSVKLDIKYATTHNFTHTKLYDSPKALLRRGTAEKLQKVADEVAKKGFRLKIWDAYRSPEAQFKMWKRVPDARYVANPYQGYSNHSRGSAVDLTLIDSQGKEIAMPTGFDNFTAAAARVNENANAKYLEKIMVKYGFKPLATEWWHFDDKDSYAPADFPQVASAQVNTAQAISIQTTSAEAVSARANSAQAVSGKASNQSGSVQATSTHTASARATSTQAVSTPVWFPNDLQIINLSAIGDLTLGQDDRFSYAGSFNEYYHQFGAGYFFAGVKKILSEDDLTIANLEGTLTKATGKPDKSFQGSRAFFFKGSPSYTTILKDGSVEAVNLANNHSMDYLDQGFKDTVAALDHAGITSFGYNKVAIYEKKGIKIGLIGVNTLGKIEEGVNLEKLKSDLAQNIHRLKEKTALIIVSFHWGTENKSLPTSEQRELGHFAIDQGADLVLGHHPHVLQPCEAYRGKCIVYSLGNFIFGGNSNPWYKKTEIFQQKYCFVNGQLVGISSPSIIPCQLSSRYRPEPLMKSSLAFLLNN